MPRVSSLEVYQQRINRVLDHIAANPAHPHSVESLARVARFSAFHFHRIF
jgi:AraC family transcriptional regulator